MSKPTASASGPTRDDWLRAMAESGVTTHEVDDQHALTVYEFAEMFNLPHGTAYTKLKALDRAGKATLTRKTVTNSYGRRVSMKAYRITI